MSPTRRHSVSTVTAAGDIQHSNETSSRFLGTVQRSWMRPGFQLPLSRPSNCGVTSGSAALQTAADQSTITQHLAPEPNISRRDECSRHEQEQEVQAHLPWTSEPPHGYATPVGGNGAILEHSNFPIPRDRSQSRDRDHAQTESTAAVQAIASREGVTNNISSTLVTDIALSPEIQIAVTRPQLKSPVSFTRATKSATILGVHLKEGEPDPNALDVRHEQQLGGLPVVTAPVDELTGSLTSGRVDTIQIQTQDTQTSGALVDEVDATATDLRTADPNEAINPRLQSPSPICDVESLPAAQVTTSTAQARVSLPATASDHPAIAVVCSPHGEGLRQLPSPLDSAGHALPTTLPTTLPAVAIPHTMDSHPQRNNMPTRMGSGIQSPGDQTLYPDTTAFLPELQWAVNQLQETTAFHPYMGHRISMLHHALISHDHFYLVFHQIYAQWTLNAFQVSPTTRFFFDAFRYIEAHLLPNAGIPSQVLQFFGAFPNLPQITKQHWLGGVNAFLKGFEAKMHNLMDICSRGQAPPSAQIASHFLLCQPSPILQQFVFQFVFARLFSAPPNAFLGAAFDLFLSNQRKFFLGLQRRTSPTTNVFAEPDVLEFRNEFNALCIAHGQRPGSHVGLPFSISYAHGYAAGPGFANVTPLPQGPPPQQPVAPVVRPVQPQGPVPHSQPHLIPQQRVITSSSTVDSSSNVATGSHHAPLPNIPNQVRQENNNAVAIDTVFFPPPDSVLPIIMDNDPNRTALHQVLLRSPPFRLATTSDVQAPPLRVYTFFDRLLTQPKIISSTVGYVVEDFKVSRELYLSRTKESVPAESDTFGIRTRIFDNDAAMFRLRCVAVNADAENFDSSLWTENSTRWPYCAFFSINGNHVEVRRKIHHRKDLSADITQLLKEDLNRLEISYHIIPTEATLKFFVAVEVARTVDHNVVVNMPTRIDPGVALNGITSTLQSHEDDDEIVMVDAHLSIDLVDPFTAQLCTIPVRGKHCLHRECFDLEAFLQSRVSHNDNGVISPDFWQCPICKRDARPNMLVIDGFLQTVCERLIKDGKTDARAVLVGSDGTWQPKYENPRETKSGDSNAQLSEGPVVSPHTVTDSDQ